LDAEITSTALQVATKLNAQHTTHAARSIV
jgi:hypothetical protein